MAARDRSIRGPSEFAEAFEVSRETGDRLDAYAALLRRWQKTINLVAPSTLDDIWNRHFADSAQLLKFAPDSVKTWLDIGSGAGFPGLVVAIMLPARRQVRMVLIESDSRKAAFLGEAARATGVVVDIVCARIESSSTHAKVGPVDIVSARALAPMGRLLELASPFLSSRTKGLFLKGRNVETEIAEASATWSFAHRLEPSLTDPEGRIVVIENLHVKSEG